MFSRKKVVTSSQFCRNFIEPLLDEINEECTEEILAGLKNAPFTSVKSKKEIELEIAMWLEHISGKLVGEVKLIRSHSPEALNFSKEMLEHFYEKWGEDEDHEKFILEIKTKYLDKTSAYETYEFPFSRGKIRVEDFEACNAVILLGVKYEELTESFVKLVEELHKGSTGLIHEFLDTFSKEFVIVDDF